MSGERRIVKDDQVFMEDRSLIWGRGMNDFLSFFLLFIPSFFFILSFSFFLLFILSSYLKQMNISFFENVFQC